MADDHAQLLLEELLRAVRGLREEVVRLRGEIHEEQVRAATYRATQGAAIDAHGAALDSLKADLASVDARLDAAQSRLADLELRARLAWGALGLVGSMVAGIVAWLADHYLARP